MSSISSVGSNATNTFSSTGSSGVSSGSAASGSSASTSGLSNISGTGILSSLGLGSGLDVSSIISALVTAAEAGPQASITNQTNEDNNEIAGLTALSTSLAGLQSALSELTSSTTYNTFTASLANSGIGAATALGDATPGNYNLDVTQLASAQTRSSNAYSATSAVGSGTLDISIGSESMSVSVSSTDSLADIAAEINDASDNPGVTANVVAGTQGDQLVLASNNTGVANSYSISVSGAASSGLSALATSLDTPGSEEATDAKFTIDGIAVDSASNNVTGSLTGVTLNLTATGSTQLSIAQDTSTIGDAVSDFVSAYNDYASTVSTLDSYDSSTGEAGVLLGDQTLGSLQSQISGVLGASVAGNSIGTLASLGITRNSDGSMSLNTGTLDEALSANPSAVQGLFDSASGIANQLSTLANNYNNSSTGIITQRITSLNSDLTTLSNEQTALNSRMSVYEQQLVQQYTNLDTMMTSLNNTSSYLTEEINDANKSSSSN